MPRRGVSNKNEKSERNLEMFHEHQSGEMLVDIAQRHGLSIPRVHRILQQEELKFLRTRNNKLETELKVCRRR